MITATHKGKYYDVEYSLVNVSELEGELRIDAEYYDPLYLETEEKIKKKKYDFVKNRTHFIKKGIFDVSPLFYREKGIPFIRVSNCHDEFIDESDLVFLDQETHEKYKNLELGVYDIVMSKVGTLGEIFINLKFEKINFSQNNIGIKVNASLINPFYLFVFLKSKYSLMQIERTQSGNVQQKLTLDDIRNLKIPILSDTFQKFTEKVVLKAYEERKKAEELYKQAEDILLEELGLKSWKLKTKKIKVGGKEFEEEENISIKKLSNVIKANRMDAEYWEPKYDEIEELIKDYKNGYSIIGKEFIHKTNKLEMYKDKHYNYVEISSVNTSTGDYMPSYLQGKELPTNAKLKLEKDDLIISKVRTYRKGIALINKVYPNLIGSSAFVVLHEKKDKQINIETLFVFLRTDIFSLWSYKFYTGTSYPTLTDEDILNLPIPLISPEIQQKISQLIQQSFKARESSKKLLEIATKTVEIAIEKNEKEALEYMKQETNL